MVKNIPAIERSTEIRFGKHVPDSTDQADNTIVFNASNVLVPTPYSNAVYLSPIRNRPDFSAPEVVLLMYDRNTKEITESGESANALVGGVTLALAVDRANVTSNTVTFTGGGHDDNNVAFVTDSNVGISNLLPQHTVSVGSNLYIDEFGSNVLVVSGNVAVLRDMVIDGNLRVNGDTTVIYAENTAIKDAFIELGQNNTSEDTTLDLGVLMHRPDALSNVVIGYREGSDEFAIGYTDAKPTDKIFTPKTDEDINVHVYGLTHVDANIYAHEDLVVDGNVYVSQNVSVTEELTVSGNVYADKDLEVVGNTYVSGNVNVTKQLSVSGNAYVSGNVEVTKALIVSANTHLKGDNVFITHTMDFLDPTTAIVTDQVSNVQIRLGQLENVSNTASNPLDDQVLLYDGGEWVNDYPMHTYIKIRNDEDSTTIEKGDAVYVKGTHNSNILNVGLAHSDSTDTMPCIGLSNQQLTTGQQGTAVAYGKALSVVTTGFIAGETVYVSNTVPGGLSNVKPFNNDLIQNVGVVTKVHGSNGGVFVTGIGRANDIPNAVIETSNASVNYVYVNSVNNDLRKIDPMKLPTKLQTLSQVVNTGNAVANAVTLRGVSITSGNGFNGDLVVAGNVTVDTNTLKVDAEANRVGILTVSPGYPLDVRGTANVGALVTTSTHISDSTAVTSKTTGALQVTGGVGIQGDIHATHANLEDVEADSVTVTDATEATSTSTGALQVTGGVGIQKDLYARDGHFTTDVTVGSLTGSYLPYADNGNKILRDSLISMEEGGVVKIAANVEIVGNILVSGNTFNITANDITITDRIIDIANNNPSHELDIGILMEHPGYNVGIIHHGTHPHHLSLGYTDAGPGTDHVDWKTDSHITANVWGHLITQNTVTVEHNDVYIVGGGLGIGIGDRTGDNKPVANIHVVGNAFVTSNITTSSNIIVGGTATATSKTTGALQVAGGLGVGGDIHATHANLEDVEADSVNITDTTASTSKTTGALKVAGGLGVAGDIHGSSLYTDDYLIHSGDTDTKIGFPLADTFTVTTANTERLRVNATGATLSTDTSGSAANPELSLYRDQTGSNGNYLGQIRFDGKHDGGNNQLYAKITGKIKKADQGGEDGAIETAIITDGSQRISLRHTGDLFHIKKGTDFQVGETANIYVKTSTSRVGINTDSPAYSLDVQGTSNVGVFTSTDGTITNATASTSKTTGALKVVGGLGVVGDIHATHANLEDVEADSVNITDTTASSSKTTGALKVAGGLGVAGDIYGANVDADSVNITDTTASSSKTTGALKVAGGLGVAGDIHATHANLEDVEADSVNITDTTASSSKTTGALKVAGGLGVAGDIYGANVDADSVNITDTTASSSKTTGALKVAGGLGVAGDIHATHANLEDVEADSVNITDTTASSSKTTGALKVAGGVGVSGALFGANANLEDVEADSVNVTDTTVATNKTSGALQVAGGVGVQGDLYAAAATFDDLTVDGTTLTVDTGNNRVGIGMNNPGYALDVTGDFNVSGNIRIGGVPFFSSQWTTTGSDIYYTTGDVGIGTDSPAAKLDVYSSSTDPGAVPTLHVGDGIVDYGDYGMLQLTRHATTGGSKAHAAFIRGGNTVFGMGFHNNTNTFGFWSSFSTVTNTPTMSFKSDGNVGIGTASPGTKFDVVGHPHTFIRKMAQAGTATNDYNHILGGPRPGTTNGGAVHFINGSARTSDGGTDTYTIRNDSGKLRLGHASFDTLLEGNVGIGTASPSAPLHVAGGTIINSDGVAKKTYSYSGDLTSGQTVANSTIKITFSAHVFYAKIVAHLVESDNEVSTFSLECGGGNWSGGTPLAIAKGPQAIFGSASTNPWSSTVTTSATTVSFKPTTNMAVAGHYNVFIEYISQHSSGVVSKITEGTTDVVTFGY